MDYKHKLLLELGFEQNSVYDKVGDQTFIQYGHYKHSLIPGVIFDFSANSIEGIVQSIWKIGIEKGKREKIDEIKRVLNLESQKEESEC